LEEIRPQGLSWISQAVELGKLVVCRLFLRHDLLPFDLKDPNSLNPSLPLHRAALSGRNDQMQLLLAFGAPYVSLLKYSSLLLGEKSDQFRNQISKFRRDYFNPVRNLLSKSCQGSSYEQLPNLILSFIYVDGLKCSKRAPSRSREVKS
jgi:hypothetical protein